MIASSMLNMHGLSRKAKNGQLGRQWHGLSDCFNTFWAVSSSKNLIVSPALFELWFLMDDDALCGD